MDRIQSSGLEDHVVLRVFPELSERVQAVVDKPDDPNTESIVIKVDPTGKDTSREFTFKIGKEEYYATLRDLPTIVESLKTKDTEVFYKSADVGQVLEVHNVLVGNERPVVSYELDNGLTPPMTQARSQRFKRMDRSVKHQLPEKDREKLVQRMDNELIQIHDNLTNPTPRFVFEELVDMEPYMEYWKPRTELKQGDDNFDLVARLAYDEAYENYLKWCKHEGIDPHAHALKESSPPASSSTNNNSSNNIGGSAFSSVGKSGATASLSSSKNLTKKQERPSIQMLDEAEGKELMEKKKKHGKTSTSTSGSSTTATTSNETDNRSKTPTGDVAKPSATIKALLEQRKAAPSPATRSPAPATAPAPAPASAPSPSPPPAMMPSPLPQPSPAPSASPVPGGLPTPGALAVTTPGATPSAATPGTGFPNPSPSPSPGASVENIESMPPELLELYQKMKACEKEKHDLQKSIRTYENKATREKNLVVRRKHKKKADDLKEKLEPIRQKYEAAKAAFEAKQNGDS